MFLITRITPHNQNAKFEILTSEIFGTQEEAEEEAAKMALKHFGKHFSVVEIKSTFKGKKIVEALGK